MRLDECFVLVSEIYQEVNDYFFAGNRADSMATTSRWIDLLTHLDQPINPVLSLFVTPTGYQSHPSSRMPANLREMSITSDTALPFYLAADPSLRDQMKSRIKSAGWKTGNGKFAEPPFLAALTGNTWLMSAAVLGQAAIFKFPWRYNDGTKSFEKSSGSSCDYFNTFHLALRCPIWVRRSVSKETLIEKITEYYMPEPHVNWLIDLYKQVIERFW